MPINVIQQNRRLHHKRWIMQLNCRGNEERSYKWLLKTQVSDSSHSSHSIHYLRWSRSCFRLIVSIEVVTILCHHHDIDVTMNVWYSRSISTEKMWSDSSYIKLPTSHSAFWRNTDLSSLLPSRSSNEVSYKTTFIPDWGCLQEWNHLSDVCDRPFGDRLII